MRRVVSLWLPTWPTDRLRRAQGAPPAETPLVTAITDGGTRLIAAADATARGVGLYPGLKLAQAQARVPGLLVVPADPAADDAALARLAAWCLRYAPLTAPDPPDGVWIDATGVAHLHGGEAGLLDDLLKRLHRNQITARVAIADTPGAASALARYGGKSVWILPPGEATSVLPSLPVAALRLPAETLAGLSRLGFERIGPLAAASRAPLARRFGAHLLERLDQMFGRRFEPIEPIQPPSVLAWRLTFSEPLITPEALSAVIARLSIELCEKLEQRGGGARAALICGLSVWMAARKPSASALRALPATRRTSRACSMNGWSRLILGSGWRRCG